jgi:hypothetical protein
MFEDILGKRDLTLAEKNQREIEKVWDEEEASAYREEKQATPTVKK